MNYFDFLQNYNNIDDFDIAFHIKTDYQSVGGVYQIYNLLKEKTLEFKGYYSNFHCFYLKDKKFPYKIFIDGIWRDIKDQYPLNKGYKFWFSLDSSQPSIIFEFIKIPRPSCTDIPKGIKLEYKKRVSDTKYNLVCYWKGYIKNSWGFLKVYIMILYLLNHLDSCITKISIVYQDKFKILINPIDELINRLENKEIENLFHNKNQQIDFSEIEETILILYAKLIAN